MNMIHKAIRVQGSDDELVEALNAAAKDGWELISLIPTGGTPTTSSGAGGSWLVVMRKKGN